MKYIAWRFVRVMVLLVGVSALCFLFTEMAPGSFFEEMRLNPQISPETITALRAHYGLDQPLAIRYAHWMASVAHGDFGYSVAYNAPVAPLLWTRAKNTLLLTTTATLLTWLIGVPLGAATAKLRGKLLDQLIGTGTSLLISVPEIVIALACLAVAVHWRLLPVGGMMSLDFDELSAGDKFRDLVAHMLLPISILVLGGLPIVARHVRASMQEIWEAPYIQAARGLGISGPRLLFCHVLRVAANPAISLFGFSLAGLVGGSLLVEVVCGWPGLGPLMVDATLSRDLYLVIGAVMFSVLFMLVGNFTSDVLLVISDPRIRAGADNAE